MCLEPIRIVRPGEDTDHVTVVISQGHIVNSLKTEKCIKKIREINNEIGKSHNFHILSID